MSLKIIIDRPRVVVFLVCMLVLLNNIANAQSVPDTKSYEYDADRTITVEYMDKIDIRVGEVVNVYCDNAELTSSFWDSDMSSCWIDHAWVFHSNGTSNNHPNSKYLLINHTDPSIGLSTLIGVAPTEGYIMMEMYYSISWRYPGSRVYVAQDDYPFQVRVYSVTPKTVSIKNDLLLREGGSEVLIPTVTPKDAMTEYTWMSDNEDVVIVDENGKLTALKTGHAIVTVQTDNGLTASCLVTVAPAPTNIVLPENIILSTGYGCLLTPKLIPDGSLADIIWTASPYGIVSIDNKGYVSALAQGEAEIVAKTDNDLEAVVRVTVVPAPEGLDSVRAKEKLSMIKKLVYRSL